jgi:hypothetical protein
MAAKRDERPTIADLLARRRHHRTIELTDEQAAEVRAAIEHNDSAIDTKEKLGLYTVWRLLREHYSFHGSRHALEDAACKLTGRTSWASK